jgi:predicted N-acetyltransferase YhbS
VAWAREQGLAGILLVGDAPYFGRFGFERIEGVTLPGPVDQARVLWLSLDGTLPSGPVVVR